MTFYDFGFLKRVYSYKHMALNICIDYGLLQQLDVDSFFNLFVLQIGFELLQSSHRYNSAVRERE